MRFDRESLSRALEARDARFDGVFFVGIATTGIYCRPICPARTTPAGNRRFFSSAAAAERAGFRPCLRCRPELAPGLARIDAVPRLAEVAAHRIAAGALNGCSVEALATALGVSGRQLRRALRHEFGVSPIALAQTNRLLLAKRLLTETRLSMVQVAHASGFQSLRRFNALFVSRYRLTPDGVRRRMFPVSSTNGHQPLESGVRLSLAFRPPLAWEPLVAFLGARATPGVEAIVDGVYTRTMRVGEATGVVRVSRGGDPTTLVLEVSSSLLPVLMPLTSRIRHLFDLDAEPQAIASHLARGGLTARRGLRVPGAVDGFELAVRAILGQQVSVAGASTLMGRLTRRVGEPLPTGEPGLTHLAVRPDRLAAASFDEVRGIGIPATRAATLVALARAVAGGALVLAPDADVTNLTRQLQEIPGVGPWTAAYITMRAMHWPDAFPASDLVLRRHAGVGSAAELVELAEGWRPWRAYAAMQLWQGPVYP